MVSEREQQASDVLKKLPTVHQVGGAADESIVHDNSKYCAPNYARNYSAIVAYAMYSVWLGSSTVLRRN